MKKMNIQTHRSKGYKYSWLIRRGPMRTFSATLTTKGMETKTVYYPFAYQSRQRFKRFKRTMYLMVVQVW